MSERLDHGGWALVPTVEVKLPRIPLTPQQVQENTEAEVRYAETCRTIDSLLGQLKALGSPILDGDSDDAGEMYGTTDYYPKFSLPHNPEAYDLTKFGPKEWAYAAYLDDTTGHFRGIGPREKVARALVANGIKMKWEFSGMSAAAWPIPEKDKPPLPEWAK